MSFPGEWTVKSTMDAAIERFGANELGLTLADDGVRLIDGCWWAVFDLSEGPISNDSLREAISRLQQCMKDTPSSYKIGVESAWLIGKGSADPVNALSAKDTHLFN